ncbi:flagellin [Bacillus mycoides]|uniref:flagellin N-terminal helical domain-containing protein n=1 Tax=Bacillus mycoides TaxID=1405 RepID=UPI0022B2C1D7|nr:flagellin [Bacillus mycoides]MCZ6943437.1 flagellin [Bacillus mycoides]
MRINTNINSMRTQEYMRQNQAKMSNSMDRLSSGKRINNASDDAAGLAIATRMRAHESGLSVAARNTSDGISLIRTADSALQSVSNILLRMRDIANQTANGTNKDTDIEALGKEFAALKEQITYVSDNTKFNGRELLKGGDDINIQTYDGSDESQQIKIKISELDLSTLDTGEVTDSGTARGTVSTLDEAITNIASKRAELGATLNRLDYNTQNVNSEAASMAASASQIEDADMAKEMSEMTKFKILSEAGISMLSQANQTPQMVSKLLQ